MTSPKKKKTKITAVPFYRQSFGHDEFREIKDTIQSGWVTTGKKTKKLEELIATYLGSKHTIATNSCTSAMHLLLSASGIGPGDEVITTPYTFAATSEAILYTGAKPVYADIDYDTLNLTPDAVAKKIRRKTKALLPVHIAGLPADMSAFSKLARANKIKIFDDAAHALGASYRGKKIGSIGDGSAFSFYATKNLTTGEGGMVATQNKRLAEKIRLLSLHAMSKGAWKRYSAGGSWRYDISELGFKYNMSDLAASLGLAQFKKFKNFQKKRAIAANRYLANLAQIDAIKLPVVPTSASDSVHAWHLFLMRLRLDQLKIDRDQFIEELKKYNIGTSVHFIPLFYQSYYAKRFKLNPRQFPQADRAFQEVITLPLYPDLKRAEIDYVCEAVAQICKKYRR